MSTRIEKATPDRFAVQIWNPNKTDVMGQLRTAGIAPYQIEMIERIKQVGSDVLGDANCIAEPGDRRYRRHVKLDDLLTTFPPLGEAQARNVLSGEDIIRGLANVHFSGDSVGFVGATCILPEHIKLGTLTDKTEALPYGNRLPIARMGINPLPNAQGETEEHLKNNSAVWSKMASYFHLTDPGKRIFSYDDFMRLVREKKAPIVPFSFAESTFNFWIKDPMIITDENQEMCGKISIRAAAVLQGPSSPSQNFPPRTVVAFEVDRIWDAASLRTWNDMKNALAESMAAAYGREQSGLRFPIAAGRMNGK